MRRLIALIAFFCCPGLALAETCAPRDFLTLPLSPDGRPAWAQALETGYPGLRVEGDLVHLPSGAQLAAGADAPERSARERLEDATIVEQFAQVYPLDFDLAARGEPWFDPGRARHEPLFRALYGGTKAEAEKALSRVAYRNGAVFLVSSRHCAAAQLQAALDAIAALGPGMDVYFQTIGGSFNWRVIAGTNRLSGHSFGMAVDFNTELGGYWRWSGAAEGKVGRYDNRYPETLVREMERHGWIWGGKWHHFDGMHFEYRPELILHARLAEE